MATEWKSLEPMGFGDSPFGHPSEGTIPETGESWKIISIHDTGFGSPKTKWTEYSGD